MSTSMNTHVRPSRTIQPSVQLSPDNAGELELGLRHRAVVSTSSVAQRQPATFKFLSEPTTVPSLIAPNLRTSSKRPQVSYDGNNVPPSITNSKKAKIEGQPSTGTDALAIDSGVRIMDAADPHDGALNKTDASADIKAFFTRLPRVPGKQRVSCNLCAKGLGCPKQIKILTSEHSTLRRHAASLHSRRYRKWCEENKFDSMLPQDTKQRRQAALDKSVKAPQASVTDYFKPEAEKPITQSDNSFACAAIEWLIVTNQSLQAFDHPSFKRMIDLVSQGNGSVSLPSPSQTRGYIIKTFKQKMCLLKERLNSPAVSGEISLTCDTWQADSTYGYFAVTGHWIEERAVGEWTEEHTLLGFVQLNMVHNGTRLGQALYRVCNRLGVVHKIGHITCDNVENNMTMIQEFARCYKLKTESTYDITRRYIRCLANVIDLAAQAVISTRSKSKYYSGDPEDDNLPEYIEAAERDEIGIIRAICIEARSSAQRKAQFGAIQERSGMHPCQLLLDMRVRWSSTFVMLYRAESQRQAVDKFVREIRLGESNNEKRRKLAELALDEEEWTRVRLFCNILQHADDAQYAFLTASRPTLHNVLPALEKLHVEWEKASKKPRYKAFVPALTAGLAKLDECYQRTGTSDAHIMAMVLNPSLKMSYFKKHWDPKLFSEVEGIVQTRFLERYGDLHKHAENTSTKPSTPNKPGHVNIDDTDSESDGDSETLNPHRAWFGEWTTYLNSNEVIPEGMGSVRWWGLHGQLYPTWRSLARDYLTIMASSVSSESAASGITANKHCNQLEWDTVEALQCLRSFIRQDLSFGDVVSAAQQEEDLDLADREPANHEASSSDIVHDGENWSWDELDEDLEDEEDEEVLALVLTA